MLQQMRGLRADDNVNANHASWSRAACRRSNSCANSSWSDRSLINSVIGNWLISSKVHACVASHVMYTIYAHVFSHLGMHGARHVLTHWDDPAHHFTMHSRLFTSLTLIVVLQSPPKMAGRKHCRSILRGVYFTDLCWHVRYVHVADKVVVRAV